MEWILALFVLHYGLLYQLSSSQNNFQIKEKLPLKTQIGFIDIPSEYRRAYNDQSQKELSLMKNTNGHKYFFINQTNNFLFTSSENFINRDTLCAEDSLCCDNERNCKIPLNVALKSGKNIYDFSISVSIEDENEPPKFPVTEITMEIPENAKISSEYPIPILATDPDSKPYRITAYNIESQDVDKFSASNTFILKTTNEPYYMYSQPIKEAFIVVRKQLDREEKSIYEFKLTAVDGGRLSATVPLKIIIVNINDNAPQFKQQSYNCMLAFS